MIEKLKQEAQEIQSYLEIHTSDNPDEYTERIKALSVYMARSGQMLADAKRLYNNKVTSQIGETIIKIAKENCLSATAQNALVKSIAEEEQYVVDWLERINRTCYHQIEALRTLISMAKEELRIAKSLR